MANIKASLITSVGNPSLLRVYDSYINAANETSRNRLQQKLERVLGEQVFGAKKVQGNPKLIPDWFVDEYDMSKEIVSNLGMFEIDKDGQLRIEAKLQRKSEGSKTRTTIGASKLDQSIIKEIVANTKRKETTNINNTIYNFLRRIGNKSTRSSDLFNYLAKNAPLSVHKPAYQKSKNLTILSRTEGSLQAYNIFFPLSKFKTPIFGVTLGSDRTLNYVLQTGFEKTLVSKLNSATTEGINKQNEKEQLDLQKSLASQLRVGSSKTTSITFGQPQAGRKTRPREKIDIIYYTTNSMPMSKATVRKSKNLTFIDEGPSLIDITAAVRGRTRLRMRRGKGVPRPPKIYERDGDFRRSIEAIANLRTNTIEYFYEPYYDSLEKYGYEINNLVEGSIRAIAQAQFNRRFNLTRRNT